MQQNTEIKIEQSIPSTQNDNNASSAAIPAFELGGTTGSVTTGSFTQKEGSGNIYRSQYRGVSYDKKKKKWRVQIKVASLGKSGVSVGYFDTEQQAARAYDRAAIGLLGLDGCQGNLNYPSTDYDKEDLPTLQGKAREEVKAVLKTERVKWWKERGFGRKRFNGRRRTSRYWGVGQSNRKNQWQARILYQGKVTHLGYYKTEQEAAQVYDRISISIHGKAGQTNFPISNYSSQEVARYHGLSREELQKALGVKPMDKSSRFRGVSKKKGKWEAKVMLNSKWVYRMLFDTEEEAAHAYDQAVWRYKPYEAQSYVNYPDSCPPEVKALLAQKAAAREDPAGLGANSVIRSNEDGVIDEYDGYDQLVSQAFQAGMHGCFSGSAMGIGDRIPKTEQMSITARKNDADVEPLTAKLQDSFGKGIFAGGSSFPGRSTRDPLGAWPDSMLSGRIGANIGVNGASSSGVRGGHDNDILMQQQLQQEIEAMLGQPVGEDNYGEAWPGMVDVRHNPYALELGTESRQSSVSAQGVQSNSFSLTHRSLSQAEAALDQSYQSHIAQLFNQQKADMSQIPPHPGLSNSTHGVGQVPPPRASSFSLGGSLRMGSADKSHSGIQFNKAAVGIPRLNLAQLRGIPHVGGPPTCGKTPSDVDVLRASGGLELPESMRSHVTLSNISNLSSQRSYTSTFHADPAHTALTSARWAQNLDDFAGNATNNGSAPSGLQHNVGGIGVGVGMGSGSGMSSLVSRHHSFPVCGQYDNQQAEVPGHAAGLSRSEQLLAFRKALLQRRSLGASTSDACGVGSAHESTLKDVIANMPEFSNMTGLHSNRGDRQLRNAFSNVGNYSNLQGYEAFDEEMQRRKLSFERNRLSQLVQQQQLAQQQHQLGAAHAHLLSQQLVGTQLQVVQEQQMFDGGSGGLHVYGVGNQGAGDERHDFDGHAMTPSEYGLHLSHINTPIAKTSPDNCKTQGLQRQSTWETLEALDCIAQSIGPEGLAQQSMGAPCDQPTRAQDSDENMKTNSKSFGHQ